MNIEKLIQDLGITRDNIKTDSRKVALGDIFVAVKGTAADGHEFISDALAKGAGHIFCENPPRGIAEDSGNKITVVNSAREILADMAGIVFGRPSDKLKIYGVTGTNGKTTTVFLLDHILNSLGKRSGLVSTVFIKSRGEKLDRASMTTPDALVLNKLLAEMADDGKKYAVVEISSHALDQSRVRGIGLEGAVFTNITPEHLDYHGNMDVYLRDKSKIFTGLKARGTAALNADDPKVTGLVRTMKFPRLVTFGIDNDADVKATNIELSAGGSRFDIKAKGKGKASLKTGLVGRYNVYNMIAAISVLLDGDAGLADLAAAAGSFASVPGRLDQVPSDAPFKVFVDYAHTPDALESVLNCLRPLTKGKLVCVFGCGGDRDRSKRPEMGRIACGICDRVIITSDNPRSEDPEKILGQIEKGVLNKNKYSIIKSRRDAIHEALKGASRDDVVLIAGKGHEDYQILGDRTIHFDDKEVAGEILRELGY
jgi:UDP-N-acetylmuramoyl-L-alanyl-D-glutamate--2,6-diaminopimelate ligase